MQSQRVLDGIYITGEQVASAPEAVRAWLTSLERAPVDPADAVLEREGFKASGDGLAICAGSEIQAILQHLREDYLACQVLFALGCDYRLPNTGERLQRVLHFDDFLRHTDVRDSRELDQSLATIEAALQRARRDATVSLHRLEPRGGIRVHQTTQHNIYRIWQMLTAPEAAVPVKAA